MKWHYKAPQHDFSFNPLDSQLFSMPCAHYIIGISNIMNLASLLLIIVSISTDYWTVVTVDRVGLQLMADKNPNLNYSMQYDPNYLTRNRGLFKTCYDENNLSWKEKFAAKDQLTGKNCIKESGFEFVQNPQTINHGPSYDDRKHLLRAHVAVQIVSIVLLVLAATFGFVGCYDYSVTIMRICAVFVFVASFLMSAAMAMFHGYEYLEKQKIDAFPFYKEWAADVPLRDFSKYEYGFSYIIGWLGTIISFLTAIFYVISSHLILADRYDSAIDDQAMQYLESEKLKVPRNMAYDYMEYGYENGANYR